MAVDRRKRNIDWLVADEQGNLYSGMKDGVMIAVLVDIRDELQRLNALLACPNFQAIPSRLSAIERNTTKRKYTRKEKA